MLGRLLAIFLMLLPFKLLMGLLELAAVGAGMRLLRLANCTWGLEGLCNGITAEGAAATAGTTGLGGSGATLGAGAWARWRLLCKPRMLWVGAGGVGREV